MRIHGGIWLCLLAIAAAGCGSSQDDSAQARMADASLDELREAAVSGDEDESTAAKDRLVDRVVDSAEFATSARNGQQPTRAADRKTIEAMRQVVLESPDEQVRADAVQTLGRVRDIDSLPVLAQALEDESLVVRREAATAIRLASYKRSIQYDPEGSPDEWKEAADLYRAYWEQIQETPLLSSLRDPRMLKKQKEVAKRRAAQN